ncbi:MAG: Fic family protein [Clostridia bacterium]|nr:Fic family protein [Clostridia bacterium]
MEGYFSEQRCILPNRLGITDPEQLKQAEGAICHVRMLQLATDPVKGEFDFAHLQHIHERLLGDVYDFAGRSRTVNIAKGDSVFCLATFIEDQQRRIFGQLKQESYLRGLDKAQFAGRLAYFAGELNALHPFREGNGRAIRLFIQQLAANAGYELAYHEANEKELMEADIAAFNGNLEPLTLIFMSILHA